jgi:hypothetical protein
MQKKTKAKEKARKVIYCSVIWVAVVGTLTLIFGKHKSEGFKVSLWQTRLYFRV